MPESIRVTADQEYLHINPGEQAEVVITVQNLGVAVGVFTVDVEGLDPTWYVLSSNSVSLFPGDRTTATLLITPPRISSSLAKTYPFTVKATSQREDAEEESISLTLDVAPFHDFFIDYRPQRARGARAAHTLGITNTGNAELAFEFAGQDADGLCRFEFDPPTPTVAAGETSEVAVTVRGKRPLRGVPAQYQYEITVSPPEGVAEPKTAFGQLEVPPRIPSWVFRMAVLAVLAVSIGLAVYYFVFYQPPVAVAEFEVSPNRVVLTENETAQLAPSVLDAEGNPLMREISWSSSNPRAVRVSEDGRVSGVSPTDNPAVITARLSDDEFQDARNVTITVLPTLVSTDCIRYEPEDIRFGVSAESKLVITDGAAEILTLNPEDDQENAVKLARQHTMRCFIGREDTGSGVEGAEVEFWIGGSGIDTDAIEPRDCDAYNPSNVQVRLTSAGEWILTDGVSLQVRLDNQEDAEAALILARRHSSRCFLSRQVNEANQITYYLTHYWE